MEDSRGRARRCPGFWECFDNFSLFKCAKPAVMKEIYRQLTGKVCMCHISTLQLHTHPLNWPVCHYIWYSVSRCEKWESESVTWRLRFIMIIIWITGDFSSPSNSDEATIQERIQLIIDSHDPDIVDDLRHHNKGRPPMYELFWEECGKFLECEAETAVDERRHGSATHLAKALSTRDLLNSVALLALHCLRNSGCGCNFGQKIPRWNRQCSLLDDSRSSSWSSHGSYESGMRMLTTAQHYSDIWRNLVFVTRISWT